VVVLVPVADMLKGAAPPRNNDGLELPIVKVEVLAPFGLIVVTEPSTVTIPLAKVNVGLLFLPPPPAVLELVKVKLPETLKLLMLEVIIVVRGVAVKAIVTPTATDAQDNVPTPEMVQEVLFAAALLRVTSLVTVKIAPEPILSVDAVTPLSELNVIRFIVKLELILTVVPAYIKIISPDTGVPPDHVPPDHDPV